MKISIISDVTFEPVIKQLETYQDFKIHRYSYANQIVAELLLLDTQPEEADFLVIHFDSFFFRYTDTYIVEILNTVKGIAAKFKGNILLSNNFYNGRHGSILKNNIGQQDQVIFELHNVLREIIQSSNIYFYDISKLITRIGIRNSYNYKLGFLYQMPYTKELLNMISTEIISLISFLSQPEKKAIFVDCDNTLWKGVLGEDGLEGIQCDRNAKGVLFFQFQDFLLEKKNEGFILGLCSKNNEEEVKEAFTKLNMPLKWDNFLIKKVNWLNKSENLQEAAKELNIGLDSFIFIDDNDFELQSIKSILPEVNIFKLVDDYNEFLLLTDNFAFKRKRLTKEDLEKNEQYIAEQQRNSIKASVQSFDEYIKSLGIKMDITVNNTADFARLSQLTEKTNQFNFNKEPFSIIDLENFIAGKNLIYGLRVSDKFGDYGLVGLILIEFFEDQPIVRNFLLSCRALGRQIEDDFFKYVKNELYNKGFPLREIRFRETLKNAPARMFLDKLNRSIREIPAG